MPWSAGILRLCAYPRVRTLMAILTLEEDSRVGRAEAFPPTPPHLFLDLWGETLAKGTIHSVFGCGERF